MHAELEIRGEGGTHRVVIRPGQVFLIGRGRDVTIRIPDAKVSRKHASLELRGLGLFVTDLSSNGTFMAGKQLPKGVAVGVPADAALHLGSHEVRHQLVGFGGPQMDTSQRFRLKDAKLLAGGEFELTEPLGKGANGRVWAAKQTLLNRMVAIKIFREDAEDPDQTGRDRFLREGRLAMEVRGPYSVDVFDLRIIEGTPVIIMELVQGPSAADRLKEGPLEVPEALLIGEHVARALTIAQGKGVVHRDVKPANILLGPDGLAKLGDFGLAKQLGGSALTMKGMGMGSLHYAAPEQIEDAAMADSRTDIYGLAASVYHLIAGHPMFDGAGLRLLELVDKILKEDPPELCTAQTSCPAEVSHLIMGMLAKHPDDRRPQRFSEIAERFAELRVRHFPDWRAESGESASLYETADGEVDFWGTRATKPHKRPDGE